MERGSGRRNALRTFINIRGRMKGNVQFWVNEEVTLEAPYRIICLPRRARAAAAHVEPFVLLWPARTVITWSESKKKRSKKRHGDAETSVTTHCDSSKFVIRCGLSPFDYINQDEFQLKLRENVLHTVTLLVSAVKRDDKTESFK